ncbi:MAG: hypothetical protein IJ880_10190 [Bacilli bacterium]|nr:hypothetical protein [Bacilli bacterium]
MATELLNRSLDLIHSKVGTVHTLEFDTTYPTKLNGFVIKIFRATANYSTGDTFSLKLADDDILTINQQILSKDSIQSLITLRVEVLFSV